MGTTLIENLALAYNHGRINPTGKSNYSTYGMANATPSVCLPTKGDQQERAYDLERESTSICWGR